METNPLRVELNKFFASNKIEIIVYHDGIKQTPFVLFHNLTPNKKKEILFYTPLANLRT